MASQPIFCIGCWQNMKLPIALRTVAAVPYRAVGIRQSRMNPNTCTICETMFERVMKARQIEIDATILFADLRGYTSLSQSQSSGAIAIGSAISPKYCGSQSATASAAHSAPPKKNGRNP